MSHTVFILGAGASAEAGAPLMKDFLDKAEGLLHGRSVEPYQEHYERVFRARKQLKAAAYYYCLELDNLEALFAALEMAQLIGKLPGLPEDDVALLVRSMRWVIWTTLQNTMLFPTVGREQPRLNYAPPYEHFVRLVRKLCARPQSTCAVVTLNYDLALDHALHLAKLGVDYGLGSTPTASGIPVLKLHGSLNWFRCGCGKVECWPVDSFLTKFHLDWRHVDLTKRAALNLPELVGRSGLKHCSDHTIEGEPFLIPPTGNQGEYWPAVAPVWQRAAVELGRADSIIVCGYSLPSSDVFFSRLLALGTLGDAGVKRLWVFDPAADSVRPRFEEILGQGLRQRFCVWTATFREATGYLLRQVPTLTQ